MLVRQSENRPNDSTKACAHGNWIQITDRSEEKARGEKWMALFLISTKLLPGIILSQATYCPLKSLVYYI